MPIRVLLADNSTVVRHAIRGLLENTDIALIAEADDFHEAIQLANKLKPQVVVIDLYMKGVDLPDIKHHLNGCGAPVVAISFAIDDEAKTLADNLGAVTLLDKAKLVDELIPTIKTFASAAN
jgi:DNA-binding NarL/FixJ family response regulator